MMARCKLNPCCGATMPGECDPPPQIKPNEGWDAYEQRATSLSPAATPEVALCEDEGCPHHGRPHICTPVTAEMVTAAMRAFEPLSTVLRYREKDGWHACDQMAMRAAIEAALAAKTEKSNGCA